MAARLQALSVIVPCYREQEVIASTIATIDTWLRGRFDTHEIIVVTDGSPDNTAAVVDRFIRANPRVCVRHIRFPFNQGKGAAVKAGFLAARSPWVLMVDADLTIGIHELNRFLPRTDQADCLIASRTHPESRFEETNPWHRSLMTWVFQTVRTFIVGKIGATDTQCGFKLFRRKALLPIFQVLTIPRFAFDTELLILSQRQGCRILTLPVIIRRDQRNTNVRFVQDSFDMLASLFRIRWNLWSGRYAPLIGSDATLLVRIFQALGRFFPRIFRSIGRLAHGFVALLHQ